MLYVPVALYLLVLVACAIYYGRGLFIVITLAGYTATLTTFLSESSPSYAYTSLDDCIASNCLVCTKYSMQTSGLLDQIKYAYPGLTNIDYSRSSRYDVVSAVRDGECDAALISDFSFYSNSALW